MCTAKERKRQAAERARNRKLSVYGASYGATAGSGGRRMSSLSGASSGVVRTAMSAASRSMASPSATTGRILTQ